MAKLRVLILIIMVLPWFSLYHKHLTISTDTQSPHKHTSQIVKHISCVTTRKPLDVTGAARPNDPAPTQHVQGIMIVKPIVVTQLRKINCFAIVSRRKDALRGSLVMAPMQGTYPLPVELRGQALTSASWTEFINQNGAA